MQLRQEIQIMYRQMVSAFMDTICSVFQELDIVIWQVYENVFYYF